MNFNTLAKFALTSNLSDFELLLPESLGSKSLPAHKIILASNSDFFDKLFEKDQNIKQFKL